MQKNKRITAEIVLNDNILMNIDDNMLYCEFGALDRGNLTDVVDWGIYANRGSLSFIDKSGYFNNYNVNSQDLKNAKVLFYLTDNDRTLISTFNVDNAEYYDERNEVYIQLISPIFSFQEKKCYDSIYPYNEKSAKEIVGLVNDKFSLNIETEGISEKIYIYCPYLAPDTAWNMINKICQATMSRVIEDEYGNVKISDTFPNPQNAILLKPNNIISIGNPSFVSLPNISISTTKREKILDEKTSIDFSIGWRGYSQDYQGFYNDEVISHSGIRMTFDTNYNRANVRGNFNTIEKLFSFGLVNLDQKKKKTLLTEDSVKEFFYDTSGYIGVNPLIQHKIEKVDDNTISFSCSFPIKETPIHEATNLPIYEEVTTSGTFSTKYSTFEDSTEEIVSRIDPNDNATPKKIESNDLVQTKSVYIDEENLLPYYILSEVQKRYGKGIECFEIECLFNDYYYEDGNLAFRKDDLSNHFKKYDVIIPYVMKQGKTVPLRKNPDGTPKKFRIIGISYSYDGLLKQKLCVQEERYDID